MTGSLTIANPGWLDQQVDADAEAYIRAVLLAGGTLSEDVRNGIRRFVVGRKASGIWAVMGPQYPYLGGTAAAHAINLRNPSANTITWGSSSSLPPTHSAAGVQFTGAGFGDTNYAMPGASLYSNGLYVYALSDDTTSVQVEIGADQSHIFDIITRLNSDSKAYFEAGVGSMIGVVVSTAKGSTLGTRLASNDSRLYKNGIQIGTSTAAPPAFQVARNIGVGFRNTNLAQKYYSKKLIGYHGVFLSSVTAAQALDMHNAVHELMGAAGRAATL